MKIRSLLLGVVVALVGLSVPSRTMGMDPQSMMIQLLKHGSKEDLRRFIDEQFEGPAAAAQASVVQNVRYVATYTALITLLSDGFSSSVYKQVSAGLLAVLATCEGFGCISNLSALSAIAAKKESAYRQLMNARAHMQSMEAEEGNGVPSDAAEAHEED